FGTLDLDSLPGSTVASVLAARDAYKKTVFRDALNELELNPAAADAAGCASAQQAASGQCLVVRPLGVGLDISNARVVERAPLAAPSAAPVAPAAPVAAAPAAAAAPSPAAAAAVRPAAALRVQPLPADLRVALPPRRNVARAAVPQIQRKIAVLIGVDNYLDNRIPKLANAVNDVRAMSSTLAQNLGYETVVLENPGKATVFRVLNQLTAQVGPNDSVVVYYAGHGERVEKTGLGYWQPADADASRPETWISNADIDRLLRQLPAQQLAMVSDSCYSGSLVSGERIRGVATTPDVSGLLAKRAVVVMTSGGNEPVFDSGLNGHSPFAWSLMQSLQQVGTWKPGSNLFEQVRFAVARKLPQRPQYGASRGGGHEPGADYLFEQRQLAVR
ncbi:MAG: caspase family protein, partial [Burkholderiaceae bacterium]|nr:caspase family protein [Burkholderiaceae bacterium]